MNLAVARFLDEVEAVLAADLPDLERTADEVLALYRGIPARVNVFDILNLVGHEDRHTDFLAWLLDPTRDHGLGDRFLRRFLALTDAPAARRLAHRTSPLRASIRTRFNLPGAGVPDLAVVVPGSPAVVLLCEAKMHAPLTRDASGKPQTTAYREWVEAHGADALLRQLGPLPPPQPAPGTTRPVLVFLRANEDQRAEDSDSDDLWSTVDYVRVERVLAHLVRDHDLPASSRALIQQFRTSLLAGGLPGREPLAALEALRISADVGGQEGRSHHRALRLRTLLDQLGPRG